MTDLSIGRLSATIHQVPGEDDARRRIDRILHQVGDHRLGDGLARLDLPKGEWCVRRVHTFVEFDADNPDASIETAWADAVLTSLQSTLDTPSADVVHYRRRSEALDDLFSSIAAGRPERSWAWLQLGVLGASDPNPDTDPAGAVLAAASRWPEQVLHSVVSAVRTAGVAALHLRLGTDGWTRLAEIVTRAGGVAESDTRRLLKAEATTPTRGARLAPAGVGARADRMIRESTLAQAFSRSALRPDRALTTSWAVLIVAEVDPGALRTSAGNALVPAVAAALSQPEGKRVTGLLRTVGPDRSNERRSPTSLNRPAALASSVSSNPATSEGRLPVGEPAQTRRPKSADPIPDHGRPGRGERNEAQLADSDAQTAASGPAGVDDAPGPAGALSAWGGLLFLLATAEAAGIPDPLLDDARLGSRSVRWVLHQLAQRLVPITGDDPAALAFAGLPPDAEPPAGAPTSVDEGSALTEAATRWAAATAELMGRAVGDAAEVVAAVSQRFAEILADPGWIEVQLRLDDVDLEIRRAGLDRDPGWVPWLGVVVRFSYG